MGFAETRLPSGKYLLTTPQPIEFQGKSYSWKQDIVLTGTEQALELSNDNAVTSALVAGPPPGSASGEPSGPGKGADHRRYQQG
jgi:hypothetical protein